MSSGAGDFMGTGVLVAGVGNIFCTDDGFGPAVITRLLRRSSSARPGARITDYGIRGMHLAYDLLDPPEVLILVDAVPGQGQPGRVCVLRIEPADVHGSGTGQLDAHGMDPATLLGNLTALGGQLPDTTLLVGCEVDDVSEGMGLTPPVETAVDVATSVVLGLLELHAAGSSLDEVV